MSREEIRELWGRFLAGEEISAEDQQRLVDALDADPELRESLLENLQLDGMLQAMNTTRRQGEGFVRNLTECLDVEHDGTRFVRKVELRLNETPTPPPSSGGTGRRTKPPTARALRRRSAASATGETAWKPALIAAGAFAAIFLLMLASTSPAPQRSDSRPQPQEEVAHTIQPVAPPAPEESKPLPERPRNEEAPLPPLTPRRFPDPKPEEPAPPRPEEKRPEGKEPPKIAPGETKPLPVAPVITMRIERLEGNVYIVRGLAKDRAKKGEVVPLGCEVETVGASSYAVLGFDDKTWVDVGGNSTVRELQGSGAAGGRRVQLSNGTLLSHIEKQPADRPMVFVTPNAEATILGTTIRLTFTTDPKPMTTLEVKEGKVALTRLSDTKSVEVLTRQFAVAVDGGELRPQKNIPDELTLRFGPPDIASGPDMWVDSGEEFDAARGYGWKNPKKGKLIPGITWRDGQGRTYPKHEGREAVRRTNNPKIDPLKCTDVVAGWAGHTETWHMPVPNGRYLVTVCCGDATWEQGPHHVAVENVQIIDQKKNKPGQFIEELGVIEVRDGELTMVVGSATALRKSSDGSTDTLINYLIIKRIDPRKK